LKLLFDQNLAPRLVARLADIFPASEHVRDTRDAVSGMNGTSRDKDREGL
jgi:hypothetical protein